MSSIHRENGVWYYQWRENNRTKKKSLRTKDEGLAKRVQKRWDAERELKRLHLAPARITIKDALEACLARREPRIKKNSMVRYRELSAILQNNIEVTWVHDLTVDILTRFITNRKKVGKAPKTIQDELALLRSALLDLYRDGQIQEVPVRAWPTMKVPPMRPERRGAYSEDDIAKLMDYFCTEDPEFGAVFRFTLFTGVRRGEVHLIRWRDLDLQKECVRIRSQKTETNPRDSVRLFPLHPVLLEELRTREKGSPTDLVFPEIAKHSRNWPHYQMTKACRKLGIQYRRFHGLRHTTASYLLSAGASLRDTMALMGWTQIDTAQGYLHLTEASMDSVSRLPWGKKSPQT